MFLFQLLFQGETPEQRAKNITDLNTKGTNLSEMLGALKDFIKGTENILLLIAAIAVGLFFLLNAIQYFLAYGNEEKAHKAKAGLLWATVGIILIILSKVIIGFIYNPTVKTPATAEQPETQGESGLKDIFGPLPQPQQSPPTQEPAPPTPPPIP